MGKFLLIVLGGLVAMYFIIFIIMSIMYISATGISAPYKRAKAQKEAEEERKREAEKKRKREEELNKQKNFVRSQIFYKQIFESIFDFVSESLKRASYLYENESPYSWPKAIYIRLYRDSLEMGYDSTITTREMAMSSFGFDIYEFECFYYEYERLFKQVLVDDLNQKVFDLNFEDDYGTIKASFRRLNEKHKKYKM